MAVFGNGNLKPWADGHCLFTRWPGNKWHLPLQNGQGLHTEIKTRTNHTIRKETSTGNGNSMKKDASGNVPHLFFFCQWYEKLNCKGISLLRNQKGHYWYLLILLSPYNLCLLLCPSLHKMSLGISNFLEEISSLSYYIVFLYFYALITEEVFLISPCYSLKLCIQMCTSFLFSFAFHFSSFYGYL